ncbi:MAG: hypothetical protein QOJ48_1322 [Frankiales bacterium]|jgi:hypothetical protein|nr:hypothetical protein [Frankiales bacterium]
MTLRWSPLPWVTLEEGAGTELALNTLLYGLGLSLLGACLWLAHIAWAERGR